MQLAGGRDVCVVASCRYLFVDIYSISVMYKACAKPSLGLMIIFVQKVTYLFLNMLKFIFTLTFCHPFLTVVIYFDVYGRPDFIFSLTAATSLVPVLAVGRCCVETAELRSVR